MALVNHTIPGLFGGVSQQDPSLRHSTQVTEMVNCYPTVIGGVTKRPPSQLAYVDNTFPEDSFVYSYDRGSGNEQYIICINSESEYRIFDIVTNSWLTSWTQHNYLTIPVGAKAFDSFTMSTVGDTTFVVNKTRQTKMLPSEIAETTLEYTFNTTFSFEPARDLKHLGVFKFNTYYVLKGTLTATITMTIDGSIVQHSYSENVNYYSTATPKQTSVPNVVNKALQKFNIVDAVDPTKDILVYINKFQTQRTISNISVDISFTSTEGDIAGSTVVTTDTKENQWDKTFFYWVKRTNGGSDSTNQPLRYTYYIYNNGVVVGQVTDHNAVTAASNLAAAIGGIAKGAVVRKEIGVNETYTGSDSWGNQASKSFTGKVKKLQDLPDDLGFEGSVIEITGDDNTGFDSYYVKFIDGVYKETVRPGLDNTIDMDSMPHKLELRRLDDDSYHIVFDSIDWGNRTVGDEDTASVPSFIGNTIQDVFFFRNRLGFISQDNVILSEAGEYYNFFPTTVTSVIDSDPIDVAVDSNKAISLIHASPFNKDLLLFGNKAQFVLSADSVLTPKDVSVQQSTAFDIKNVKPVALGPNVYFALEKNNYSSIREYFVQPDSLSNDAADITAHCPNYLPKNITKLVGSPKNDMLFALSSETPNTVYVYNFYWNGEEKAQSAWHKWTFDGTVFNIDVLGNNLLLMINRYGQVALEVIPLEYTLDFTSIEYLDSTTVPYTSSIIITKPGFPTGSDKIDDNRGTLLLRSLKLNAEYGSVYNILSHRFNRPRNFNFTDGVGLYPTKDYIMTKEYLYREVAGVYPNLNLYPAATLYPSTTTYIMNTDNKYPVLGNVNNIEIEITNNISSGFRINSLDIAGTYVKNSRNV